MKNGLLSIVVLAALGLALAYFKGSMCMSDAGPRLAVEGYLKAMKEKRFADAYDFVTARMTDGKPRKEWASVQQKLFEMGGVSIGELDVRAAKRERLNAFECAAIAKVPNVLRAADVLNNQGSTEFEVYTVAQEGGRWKIDTQESLFGEKAIRPWFPNDEIPALKDTLPTGQ
ncbi:MAG: hypothetical protein QE509_15375 [Gammaproteobacteria bacterium]|jgi:hypothetical protein|nr:hypothetical protein [Gammaproteobacteria bacterium]